MAQYIAIFNDTSVLNHVGCTAVMHVLIEGLIRRGANIAYRWPVAVDWQPYVPNLTTHKVDAIVVNGEGSIHHSRDRPRARQLCALGPFARDTLGVPAHLLNASIEALEENDLENLRSFTTITVRESRSQKYLASNGIVAEVAGDLSLSLDSPPPNNRRGILVTDSVFGEVSAALRDRAFTGGAQFQRMRLKPNRIQRIRRNLFSRPLLLQAPLEPAKLRSLQFFLKRLASAEAVLTGRFHSVCLCLLTGTPVLAVPSNSHKITGLLEDALGYNDRIVTVEALPDLAAGPTAFAWKNGEEAAQSRFLHASRKAQAAILDRIVA